MKTMSKWYWLCSFVLSCGLVILFNNCSDSGFNAQVASLNIDSQSNQTNTDPLGDSVPDPVIDPNPEEILPPGGEQLGCKSEASLQDRNDIALCEPFETADWWKNGYYNYISTTPASEYPLKAEHVSATSIVSTGCVSGSCLKVTMAQYQGGALAAHWPLKNVGLKPEELYMRYYIKLGANFSSNFCNKDGTPNGNGGKFPGLADVRSWPEVQCGNGGAFADGINCWSMRAHFRDCNRGESVVTHGCTSPTATTRFGSYLYYPKANQTFGNWDTMVWGRGYVGGSCSSDPNSVGNCGIGTGGQFENNKWYQVEMYVKMNTPGQADGAIKGWVDGVLSYEKTNMIWRFPGHKNLHVRTAWLNVHSGGEFGGLCTGSEIYLDQLVLATDKQIGPWMAGK